MDAFIPEQPAPQHIQEALNALNAVLEAPDLDIFTMAVVSTAYGRLTDLHPFHASPEPVTVLDVRTGVQRAITALRAAAEGADTAEIAHLAVITRGLQSMLDVYEQ